MSPFSSMMATPSDEAMNPPLSSSCPTATTSTQEVVAVSTSLEQQVEEALLFVDPELTKEYQRAKEVIPTIVRNETKVVDFLRAENNNPDRAAHRLARYWKMRKLLFKERWLLPMTMTGTGVLTPQQVDIIRSGFVKVVSSPANGTVFMTDFSLLPKGAGHHQVEALFYFLTLHPVELKSLFVVRRGDRPPMSFTDLVKRIMDSCAAVIKGTFVAQAYEGAGFCHLLDYLGYQQAKMSELNTGKPINHIAGDSMQSTLQQLQVHGFDINCLPTALGGNVTRSAFDNFVRTRMSVEDIMAAAPAIANHRLGTLGSPLTQAAAGAAGSSTTLSFPVTSATSSKDGGILVPACRKRKQRNKEVLSLVKLPNETEAQFAKRKNAIYVRRNYHRQKLELMVAQEEANQCRQENKRLRAENEQLENLLAQAKCWVCNLEATTTTTAAAATTTPFSPTATTSITNSNAAAFYSLHEFSQLQQQSYVAGSGSGI